ncbi:hypothetical protein C8R47DRAFT_1068050 [Mycena vitilis]|nr:hypothetical protein C8R47DRAFT_1068050 [Mycena vitilis]
MSGEPTIGFFALKVIVGGKLFDWELRAIRDRWLTVGQWTRKIAAYKGPPSYHRHQLPPQRARRAGPAMFRTPFGTVAAGTLLAPAPVTAAAGATSRAGHVSYPFWVKTCCNHLQLDPFRGFWVTGVWKDPQIGKVGPSGREEPAMSSLRSVLLLGDEHVKWTHNFSGSHRHSDSKWREPLLGHNRFNSSFWIICRDSPYCKSAGVIFGVTIPRIKPKDEGFLLEREATSDRQGPKLPGIKPPESKWWSPLADAGDRTDGPSDQTPHHQAIERQALIRSVTAFSFFSHLLQRHPMPATTTKRRKAAGKQQNRTIDSFFSSQVSVPVQMANDDDRKTVSLNAEQSAILRRVIEGQSVFFTGSAGTGKSLLLRAIIEALKKKFGKSEQVAVTASTGMAASNIGGGNRLSVPMHHSQVSTRRHDCPCLGGNLAYANHFRPSDQDHQTPHHGSPQMGES